jgi:L-threonylcarbamoyladenylate synthase
VPSRADHIQQAVDRLRAGELVAFPTETVYGLGANALDDGAVAKVYALKGRPSSNPLIVHVADEEMARRVVAQWPDEASKLAGAFWPGPLSIILPKAACISDRVTAGSPNVAVRCPDHPLSLELLHRLGVPLVGPSANPSGRISPTTAAHVRESFPNLMVLDGGVCRGGIESSVVSLVGEPRILRPGLITREQIQSVLRRPVAMVERSSDAAMESPGQMESHYAPRAKAVRFHASHLDRVLSLGGRVVVLSHSGLRVAPPHALISMPVQAGAYASELYAAMRRADEMNPDVIAVEEVTPIGSEYDRGIWGAVADRVRRATTEMTT